MGGTANESSSISVVPYVASLGPGGSMAFSAVKEGAVLSGVVWSASMGSITSTGLYSAPTQVGSYTVQAKYGGVTGTATATVAAAGTPQALYGAAVTACANMKPRTTGTIHYFCDCQSGAESACAANNAAGDDSRASTTNANDCTNKAAPCRTFAQANKTFNRMPGGDTIAFCKGGSFTQSGPTTWYNPRCAAAADMRAESNTTTCDVRDYDPSWGGGAKPVIRQTSYANLFVFASGWTHGARFLNLDFEGGGTGCGGKDVGIALFEVENGATDVLACNNTINAWYLAGNMIASRSPALSGFDFYGNTITHGNLDAFLGGGDNFTYDANYIEDTGSCTGTTHVIYPASNKEVTTEQVNLRVVNNWVRFVNTTCQGPMISGHSTLNGVLFENNLIQASKGTSACWGMGLVPDIGYPNVLQYTKNLVIRRNRIETPGWIHIYCASCPGAIVEDNVLISNAPSNQNPLIKIPVNNVRTVQPDPITTGVQIRNNTIYVPSTASSQLVAIDVGGGLNPEGTGYVIANNSIYMGNGGNCWATPWSDDHYTVTNNSCFGGKWDNTPASSPITADPLYTNAPTDFKPTKPASSGATGSPMIGAGSPNYAPSTDFNLVSRPNPPSIGAYEP